MTPKEYKEMLLSLRACGKRKQTPIPRRKIYNSYQITEKECLELENEIKT
jgi:hypothetical protein